MTAPKRLTDPDFVYVPACSTDIRKTFARVREQMAKATVTPIKRKREPKDAP